MPVMPGFSLEEPTWATHPPEMRGSPERSTISSFMPLERVFSVTGICWARVTPPIPIARIAAKTPLPRRSDLNVVAITRPKMQRQHPEATAEMDGAPGTSTIR